MASNEPFGPMRPASALSAWRQRAAEALRFHPREVIALALLGLLVLAGATLAYVRARPTAAAALAPVEAQPSASAAPAVRVFVHVVGAVRRPGVYSFDEGARVTDAIEAAGGFARGADRAVVNLARLLVDGEQIVVPKRGAASAPAPSGGGAPGAAGAGPKVNINTAGVAEFDSLPGIGPVLAQRILDYRQQHGPFRSVRDLTKVSGIGPRTFESLESYVTI